MLQTLVENAVQHGLEPKPEGGKIDLAAEIQDGKLRVTVADTGLGFSPNARAGVGLANIRERLQQLYGTSAGLTIEPNQPCGTRAIVSVPYAVA
jgi:LytS/YehU family sensor histidine kinase